MIERAKQVACEIDLRSLVRKTNEGGDTEAVEAVDAILALEAATKGEGGTGIVVGMSQPRDSWMVTANSNVDCRTRIMAETRQERSAGTLQGD